VQKTDKLVQMKIKNKQERQFKVGFVEDGSETEEDDSVKDLGPKIVILKHYFSYDEAVEFQKEEEVKEYFEQLEVELREKLLELIPSM